MNEDRACTNGGCSPSHPMHHRKGPSSYWMHDPAVIREQWALRSGEVFLDLGCGTGDYTILAAKEVGELGFVYATDIRQDLIDSLHERAISLGLNHIRGIVGHICEPWPIPDASVDLCFISTVLHTMDLPTAGEKIIPEVKRVLKANGRIIIIECKKEQTRCGPPVHMRISPEELDTQILRCGFERRSYRDLDNNYLVSYSPAGAET